MFFTSVALGSAFVGFKSYKERKRERHEPLTVAAEKMGYRSSLTQKTITEQWIVHGQESLNELREVPIRRLVPQPPLMRQPDIRQQQVSELSDETEGPEIVGTEKEVDYFLALSTSSLALSAAGATVFSPLSLLALPGLFYMTGFVVKNILTIELPRGRFGVSAIDFLSTVGPILTGNFLASSLTLSFYFLSRKLLLKTEDHSRKSLIDVFGERPRFVWVESNGVEMEIPFEAVEVGDVVIVHAGQTIPVDGTIVGGEASIDERALTGESQPVDKEIGDQVFASTILLSGKVRIRVENAGSDTVAAQIGDILEHTTDFKSQVLSRSEKIIEQGASPTLALSALALPVLGLQGAVATLFASFGYHMRIAGPLSVLSFLRMASERGILIKDGRSLELLSDVDTFVFDKTGTLTEEVPTVGQLYTCGNTTENDLLTLAAAAEYKQAHPIAQAIREEAATRELNVPAIHDTKVEVGYGLKVRVAGWQGNANETLIRVGSARFMEMEEIAIPAAIKEAEANCHAEGYSLVYVAIDDQLGGAIELHPTIRPETKEIIRELKERDISIYIISGDHQKPTQKLAQSLGIENYFAEVLPQDKASLIEQLQSEGKSVCFVGDGINDSIALKQANVSISLSGASTIATDTAGIVLMDGSLKQLIPLLDIAYDLDTNLSQSTIMTVIPGIVCVGGVFFLHWSIVSAILWYNVALCGSVSNSLLPYFRHARQRSSKDEVVA